MNCCPAPVRLYSTPALTRWRPRRTEALSSTCRRVSYAGSIGRKNGSPMRKPSAKSMPTSGKGRPPRRSNCGGPGSAAPGMSGPSYQRGRSSRAHCTRNSFDNVLPRSERSPALNACDRSPSMPLADRPHESTSKVPFTCSAHVWLYLPLSWWRASRVTSILARSDRASSVRRMGPNSSSKRPGHRACRNDSSRASSAGFTTRRSTCRVSAAACWS